MWLTLLQELVQRPIFILTWMQVFWVFVGKQSLRIFAVNLLQTINAQVCRWVKSSEYIHDGFMSGQKKQKSVQHLWLLRPAELRWPTPDTGCCPALWSLLSLSKTLQTSCRQAICTSCGNWWCIRSSVCPTWCLQRSKSCKSAEGGEEQWGERGSESWRGTKFEHLFKRERISRRDPLRQNTGKMYR